MIFIVSEYASQGEIFGKIIYSTIFPIADDHILLLFHSSVGLFMQITSPNMER